TRVRCASARADKSGPQTICTHAKRPTNTTVTITKMVITKFRRLVIIGCCARIFFLTACGAGTGRAFCALWAGACAWPVWLAHARASPARIRSRSLALRARGGGAAELSRPLVDQSREACEDALRLFPLRASWRPSVRELCLPPCRLRRRVSPECGGVTVVCHLPS